MPSMYAYASAEPLTPQAATARHAALDLIGAVLRRRRPLDDAIEECPAMRQLSGRDRAFARLLVATALRRLGQIDALIALCLSTPLAPRAAVVHDILRLGVAQLLFLRTPPHAAVATSVDLAHSRGFLSHKGLVNAVLRRLSVEGAERVAAQDAARLNTPDWLWRSWSCSYGEETARAIATAHLKEAPLDLTLREDAEAWCGRLQATLLPTGTLRRPAGGSVAALPGYAEGAWWVQDAAAALPARLFGDLAGREVVDLCAAPGGKTAQLATAGARVTAVDRSTRRLDRLVANFGRLGLPVEAVAADALDLAPAAPDRRGAARRAVHDHRRDPPPSGRAASEGAGGRRPARGGSGEPAARRGRDAAAGRDLGLLHLLARAGGRAAAHRGAAARRRAGGAAGRSIRQRSAPTPNGSPPTAICARCRAISPNMTASTAFSARGWSSGRARSGNLPAGRFEQPAPSAVAACGSRVSLLRSGMGSRSSGTPFATLAAPLAAPLWRAVAVEDQADENSCGQQQ